MRVNNYIDSLKQYKFQWDNNIDKIQNVKAQARAAMNFYNIGHWDMTIDTQTKKRAGQCIYNFKSIGISKWLIELNSFNIIRATI